MRKRALAIKRAELQQCLKKHIEDTYNKEYRIEAMILLYHAISYFMHTTFVGIAYTIKTILLKTNSEEQELSDSYRRIAEAHFGTLADVLFQMGVYTRELHDKLKKLQEFRSRLMHRFFTGKINKATYGKNYKLGMELYDRTLMISDKYPQLFYTRLKSIMHTDMLIDALSESTEKRQKNSNDK